MYANVLNRPRGLSLAMGLLLTTCSIVGTQERAGKGPAHDQEYRIAPGQVVEGNVVTTDKTVQVYGKVNGSVFATRGVVYLHKECEVTGDVIVSGGKLEREEGATVGGSVIVVPPEQAPAQEAPKPLQSPEESTSPNVRSGDVVRFGEAVTVTKDEIVEGDVVCFGGPVTVSGEVRGDVATFGGAVSVSGKVKGNVVATGGSVKLEDGAVVEGDAVAIGGHLIRGSNVTVSGNTQSLTGPFPILPWAGVRTFPHGGAAGAGNGSLVPLTVQHKLHPYLSPLARGFGWLFTTVSMLLLAGVITLVAPRAANTVATKIEEEPLRVAFFGVVGWLLFLPILFVLVILVLTWILIPFALLAFVLLLVIGCTGLCLYGGRRLAHMLNWRMRSLVALTGLGLVALRVAGLVGVLPYGDALYWALISCFLVMGLGAALMTRFGTDPTGTWLGHRFNHHVTWPGRNVSASGRPSCSSPPPSGAAEAGRTKDGTEPTAAAAPPNQRDFDDRTLDALSQLPPDDDGDPT